ncbi:succinyldiaminopimelate transaminase [Nocardioides sp. SLBN-35]|uniref:succinyldiaminopimelate transaminase n=1 Tax=Nocardioides sp. SLBN-35 TaxID=2768445 RepID=UPI00116F30A2|nr:succinyldiaminopimelate aminotransferase [Nocardioides sp. SLBN-35]
MTLGAVSGRLPDFPWDKLPQYAAQAREHDDGIVDLSIGTPVDPTPEVARAALAQAADSPGYPLTIGTPEVRRSVVDWLAGTHGVTGLGLDQVLPLIGSKEFIASLPTYLGLGPGDLIGYPALAYPTYEVGAALVGAKALATDALTTFGPETPKLLWVNSPSNPSGRVLPKEHLKKVVDWCRERGVLLVSDECYLDCVWEGEALSVLHPDISGGSAEGILVVHSLSKRSNLAGYRCAFVAGDRDVIAELLAVRKNLGLMMPAPQQHAMAAVLGDEAHVKEQHERYRARRTTLRAALEAAGYTIDHSEASLYLWTTKGPDGPDCWQMVADLAAQGILVAPGAFYGAAGSHHVRVALTATDERIAAAAARLTPA